MRGEVHDGIHALHGLRQRGGIGDVALDQLKALGESPVAGGKIVVEDDRIAMPAQRSRGVAPDVPGTSSYKNGQALLRERPTLYIA
jgi:hypothetical protein